MGRNCLEEFLTDKCKHCPFWWDGSNTPGVGCGIPAPIMMCPAFAEMYNREEGVVSNAETCTPDNECPND